ncbi:MAG: hypothetical protein KAS23_12480, partial [Anaerohalosphaera sp.]|nr:hypothetical protein [Anaerohalosphaera sp.]
RFNVVFVLLLGGWLGSKLCFKRLAFVGVLCYLVPIEYGIIGILLITWCCIVDSKLLISIGICLFAIFSIPLGSDYQGFSVISIIPLYLNLEVPRYCSSYWYYAVFPLSYLFSAILQAYRR